MKNMLITFALVMLMGILITGQMELNGLVLETYTEGSVDVKVIDFALVK